MLTKHKGTISEYGFVCRAMERHWGVLLPVGDYLAYDVVVDVCGMLRRIQVKAAWFCDQSKKWVIDHRRHKTNRKLSLRDRYGHNDFDFVVCHIQETETFYIIPSAVMLQFSGKIILHEGPTARTKLPIWEYKEAWHLIEALTTRYDGPK